MKIWKLIGCWILFTAYEGISSANPDERWECQGTDEKIRLSWLCDSDIDCSNGVDESIATCGKESCTDREFDCGEGICIKTEWRCDKEADCLNSNDEKNCSSQCEAEFWRCTDGLLCVEEIYLCDGENDCTDNSDEDEDICEERLLCGDHGVKCFNPAICVSENSICDNIEDCSDGSDEANCTDHGIVCENPLDHSCKVDGVARCIPPEALCNNSTQCDDGYDESARCEEPCPKFSTEENFTSCQHICYRTPLGPKCRCYEGYRTNGSSCVDIDECSAAESSELVKCTQNCLNTEGNYSCTCSSGYALEPDGYHCKAEGTQPPRLYLLRDDDVREMSLNGVFRHGPQDDGNSTERNDEIIHYTDLTNIKVPNGSLIVDLDYDWNTGTLVWLEKSNSTSTIRARTGNGSTKALLKTDLSEVAVKKISIDWVGKNVFFITTYGGNSTDSLEDRIGLVPLNDSYLSPGQSHTEIHGVAEGFSGLSDLIVISQTGKMITCEYKQNGRILGIAMDGSYSWDVIYHHVSWPISLAYDAPTETIFWAQLAHSSVHFSLVSSINSIQKIKMDGTGRKTVLSSNSFVRTVFPLSVSVFESRLIWFERNKSEVISVSATDGRGHVVLAKFGRDNGNRSDYFGSLLVTHPVIQLKPDDRCSKKACSHACVVSSIEQTSTELAPECLCPQSRKYFRYTSECKEKVHESYLMTKENGKIRKIFMDGSVSSRSLLEIQSALSLVYDQTRNSLYFSSAFGGVFYVDFADETTTRSNAIVNKAVTRHLTVDTVSGNVYWISDCAIHVAPPGPEVTSKLRSKNLPFFPEVIIYEKHDICPQGLAFDSNRHKLFFAEANLLYGSALMSMSVDGGNVTKFRNIPAFAEIVHMTFDVYDDRLFFIGKGYFDTVLIVSVGIKDKTIALYKPVDSNVTSIAVSPKFIFTYSVSKDTIWRQRKKMTKSGSSKIQPNESHVSVLSGNHGGGLVFVDPDLNVTEAKVHPCHPDQTNSQKCAQICFPYPEDNYKCECGQGYVLSPNGYECVRTPCRNDEFFCEMHDSSHQAGSVESDSECILKEFVCDGQIDCTDGSDESDAICDCEPSLYALCKIPEKNSTANSTAHHQCVFKSYICDGDFDCANKADELGCPCNDSSSFRCPVKDPGDFPLCIPTSWINDGEEDCPSGGDEADDLICNFDEFMCQTRDECVTEELRCDGYPDCADDSDEYNCPESANVTSTPATIATNSATSTPTTTALYTTALTVTTRACTDHEFQCGTGDCLSITWTCDNVPDCPDNSDEGGKCDVACSTHSAPNCAHECHPTPKGPYCPCSKGFNFDFLDGGCEDKDECSDQHPCDQLCSNTYGSFKCSCTKGYVLENGHRCKSAGRPPNFIIATSSDLRRFTARSSAHYDVIALHFNGNDVKTIQPRALAVKGNEEMYWFEDGSNSLYLTNVWTGETRLLANLLPRITVLEWDWIGSNLYWLQENSDSLGIMTADGQYAKTILTNGEILNSFALHPLKNRLFYSSTAVNGGKLYSCRMDGLFCNLMLSDKNSSFECLAVDYFENKLYWALGNGNQIESMRMDTVDRKTVVPANDGKKVVGITIFEDLVTWMVAAATATDLRYPHGAFAFTSDKASVYSINKNSYDLATLSLIKDSLPHTNGFTLIQEWSQQPLDFNLCSDADCSFFCINNVLPLCHCPNVRFRSTSTAISDDYCKNLPVCFPPTHKGVITSEKKQSYQKEDAVQVICSNADESIVSFNLTCQENGDWYPNVVNCDSVPKCHLPSLPHAISKLLATSVRETKGQDMYFSSTVVSITCLTGFQFEQRTDITDFIIECKSDGEWNQTIPACLPSTEVTGDSTTQAETTGTSQSNFNHVRVSETTQETKPTARYIHTNDKIASNRLVLPVAVVVAALLIILFIVIGVILWRKSGRKFSWRRSVNVHKLSTPLAHDTEGMGVDNPTYVVSYTSASGENEDGVSVQRSV